ncbi:hypothetical protein KUTeg_005932 [Tegillarca granosa]|uniref:Uncharacterized protein n=1 Tax=Tegillarca granosa TaxID=220873 RepID=A0ABQ9FJS2_TEGGR|nr:hypothetical protein KUTeg_005932 [Tegillarca granosa]
MCHGHQSRGKRRKDFIDLQKNISLYSITANCLDTGKYICTASNGIGYTVTNETDLFVRCEYNSSENTTKHLHHDKDDINIVSKSHIYWQISELTKPIMTEE